MPNINAICIRGFQSHTDSMINLSDGLNVITGPSGQGKTAIIRAVRWVAFGEPSGEAFVNEAVGEAEVTLYLDTGVTVSKSRRKGKTSYKLSTIEEPFDKAEVPEEVKQALGIEKQTFGDFEATLNFAYQLDAPFLISETASAGAKILGKLAGTEVVDGAIKQVSKDTHAARQERGHAEKEIQRIDTKLLEYHDLQHLKEQIEACEHLIEKAVEASERAKRLDQLSLSLSAASDKAFEIEAELEGLMHLPEIEQDLQHIEKSQQRYDALLGLYGQYSQASDTIARLTNQLTDFEGLELVGSHIEALSDGYARYATLSSLSTAYTGYAQEVNTIEASLEKLRDLSQIRGDIGYLETLEKRYERLRVLDVSYGHHKDAVEAYERELQQLKVLEEAAEILGPLSSEYERLMMLRGFRTKLMLDDRDIDRIKQDMHDADRDIRRAEYELERVWEEAGGVCPLCEQGVHVHA